jgi:hypothetical protein
LGLYLIMSLLPPAEPNAFGVGRFLVSCDNSSLSFFFLIIFSENNQLTHQMGAFCCLILSLVAHRALTILFEPSKDASNRAQLSVEFQSTPPIYEKSDTKRQTVGTDDPGAQFLSSVNNYTSIRSKKNINRDQNCLW